MRLVAPALGGLAASPHLEVAMSRPLLGSILAALLSTAAAAPATAQATAAAASAASPAPAGPTASRTGASAQADSAERLLSEMRERLRRLVVAQESHYRTHGTYTTDLAALEMLPTRETRRSGAVVTVVFAGGRGWTAEATDRALPGKSCVMFVGGEADVPRLPRTRADGRIPAEEGSPLCDDPR
jgi:hypothetical protein